MSTQVTLQEDVYPFGCKGDVVTLTDEKLKQLDKVAKARKRDLYKSGNSVADEKSAPADSGEAAKVLEDAKAEALRLQGDAETVLADARDEAARIKTDAQTEATTLVEDAKVEAEQIKDKANADAATTAQAAEDAAEKVRADAQAGADKLTTDAAKKAQANK